MKMISMWCVLFAALWTAQAGAQTADEVIDKHLAASGGREALGKLQSRSSSGTIAVSAQGAELKGEIEIYNKAPNKARVYMKLDLTSVGAGEMIVDQRFDGEKGYVSNSMQGDREMTGGQLENMRNGVFPSALLNYKESGAKVEVTGKEKLGDRDVIVLRFTPKTGSSSKQYFDAETYQLLKLVATVDVPELGGEVEQSSEFQDYREVDGVKIPFRVKVTSPVQVLTITITKLEHNKQLDESMFGKPAVK